MYSSVRFDAALTRDRASASAPAVTRKSRRPITVDGMAATVSHATGTLPVLGAGCQVPGAVLCASCYVRCLVPGASCLVLRARPSSLGWHASCLHPGHGSQDIRRTSCLA